MTDCLKKFDHWLINDGSTTPAALVIREYLMPVEGTDGVLFPPTYAAGDKFAGGYNIDGPSDGENVCLVDSVGSQANRIEPIFQSERYSKLVPQISVTAGDRSVSIFEAGHRAADALVRCSSLQAELEEAFKNVLKGSASSLARIAPTSLVFGVWDSRGTEAKLPRLIASTIRAINVRPLTRSAQFVPAASYVDDGLLDDPEATGNKKDSKGMADAYAALGFIHIPASAKHGGVIASGGIRRDATLSIAALRLLSERGDESQTMALRRYILGISLVAFTHPSAFVGYLRQGCNLVRDPNRPHDCVEVHPNGQRKPFLLTADEAFEFALKAAEAFGVGESKSVPFDKESAKRQVNGKIKEKSKAKAE